MKLSLLKYRFLLAIPALVVLLSTPAASSIIRVKWDSATDGPGSDWSYGYHTVTAAMNAAQAGDEIWVEGDSAHPYIGNLTLKSGVGLYGGFAGAETSHEQRNWRTNATILDTGAVPYCHGCGGNVVSISANASSTTVIDGFTLTHGIYGIYCDSSSSPTIRNNTIRDNSVGIACGYHASPSIVNNTIMANGADGIYCELGDCSLFVANNIIIRNGRSGIDATYAAPASIINNTIVDNGRRSYPGGDCGIRSVRNGVIANNIVCFNASGISGSAQTLSNNCIYNPGGSNFSGSTGTSVGNIFVDPKLASPDYGRVHIQPDSPCMDAGLDSAVQPGWKDMDGQDRVLGMHVDIGADESDGTTWSGQPLIVRVSPSGVDDASHDGSTWALAKQTVQTGIDAAAVQGGEVWVAAGNYPESVTIPGCVSVYGGFSGVESNRSQRCWTTNETVLRGDTHNYYATVTSARGRGTSVLDGCTITGNAYNGIWCFSDSLSISNNRIELWGGTNIYCDTYSSPSITNNIIVGRNNIGIDCDDMSTPYIANNSIVGCFWGIYLYNAVRPVIANNIVAFCFEIGIYAYGYTVKPQNNCVYNPGGTDYSGLSAGVGDISADPQFVYIQDPGFVSFSTDNFHLKSTSPCIDKGLNSGVLPGAVDMDGEARILPVGGTVDIGADEFTSYSVSEAKITVPDGRWVCLNVQNPVAATARFPGDQMFYVERLDRSSGIRCSGDSLLDVGQTGVLQGIMGTVDGERVLTQASVVDGTLGTADIPNPLFTSCLFTGGSAFGLQGGVLGGQGLNNIGLLVRIAGKVTDFEPVTPPAAPSWFKIDDGSGASVKCLVPSGVAVDPNWAFVAVTGISSCEKSGGDILRLIRVRTADDITAYPLPEIAQ